MSPSFRRTHPAEPRPPVPEAGDAPKTGETTDPEVAPIVRVDYHKKLEHQQESNLAELNRMKKKYNESFKSAMNDVIMAREQFERNHKARMAELQEQLEKMSQSDSFDNDQIDQKIKETRKALEDLLK